MNSSTPAGLKPPPPNPLIPEKYLDIPSQRLYYLSLGLLCQSIKILDFIWSLASGEDRIITCRKWLLVDFVYCIMLSQLRIPRLEYSKASVILQVVLLWFLDGVLFGGINVNVGGFLGSSVGFTSSLSDLSSSSDAFSFREFLAPLTFGLISSVVISRDSHLLGQHTVRMSPISTAHLNPENLNFCLSPTNRAVLIPVVLNNTNIAGLRYSVTPLGYTEDGSKGKITMHDMTSREVKALMQNQLAAAAQPSPTSYPADEYDEYDDDDEETDTRSTLQQTQSMAYISLARPGIIRLERVVDNSNTDAKLIISEAIVVPCPQVEFAKDEGSAVESTRCAGQERETQLKIKVQGVPPLSLRWLSTVNGRRERSLVEGIEGDKKDDTAHKEDIEISDVVDNVSLTASPIITRVPSPQDVLIPLTISLKDAGTYLFALEEITDGVGNSVRIGIDAPSTETDSVTKTKTTRSYMVLKQPVVSFGHCSSDTPASLLIGSEATVDIRTEHISPYDVPLDVSLAFVPPADLKGKLAKGWEKTLQLNAQDRQLNFRANAPGEYKILGIKGKYCTGTVQAPDVCRVVQKPRPSAEIKWQNIQDCSGDTGVTAFIVLHGTPPFQIYYTMRRDNELAAELSKTITSSRYEMKLEPKSSGHYAFAFVAVSDANYRKVELSGPSIDKMIHPIASAEFSESQPSAYGRSKKIVSSCSGDTVDIDVDLRGTGPWNLELQIISPERAEVVQIPGIETPRKRIPVSIPRELRKNGGNFEVNLLSVEDASNCKNNLSVPGVQVQVKRIVPTAQFYGSPSERNLVIAEDERANLPLRLTGDGPWVVEFRRNGASRTIRETFSDRNANFQVMNRGLYEIDSVKDSQCSGTVTDNASSYTVEWIPRPSAKLSASTQAIHDIHNGSYILPAICEGVNDHVDLDLTGRPPFEIMYNIAQNSDTGGTKIMGQPIFNSIQPHTRFQLTTSTPGRMYYEVKQIGDAAYPLAKSKDRTIPRNQRLLFEQQVALRPSARFRNLNRLAYCLYDTLVALDGTNAGDGVIVLEGLPPFTIVLAIRNIAASNVETHKITVPGHTWRVNVPAYIFSSIGPHLLIIESVTDTSGCAHAALDQHAIWADVAEAASIIPLERREHICVGDAPAFQLQGSPPWTVGYTVNGRAHTQAARTSPFAVMQQQPGLFAVTSIAHQAKMCKAAVADLRFHVHALPSAQVGHGKRIFQDIHEGDQAEIVFTLIGEPPFTFTYQRSEISLKKGAVGKVLETHTVSRVQSPEYSIFSALEGTWTVTSISDKYCRYPPMQPEQALEKHK